MQVESPDPSEPGDSGLFDAITFDDGVGWLSLVLTVILAVPPLVVWLVRIYRKRKDEASLVTSHYRFTGGLGIPYEYEISIHNASPHPLRIVMVMHWNGSEFHETLARSTTTGDPVLMPGAVGAVRVPALTTDLREFDLFYYYRFTDSRNRNWSRRIDSPDFVNWWKLRRMKRKLHRMKKSRASR